MSDPLPVERGRGMEQHNVVVEFWSGDALAEGPKLLLIVGDSGRELTALEALEVAAQLVAGARRMEVHSEPRPFVEPA